MNLLIERELNPAFTSWLADEHCRAMMMYTGQYFDSRFGRMLSLWIDPMMALLMGSEL